MSPAIEFANEVSRLSKYPVILTSENTPVALATALDPNLHFTVMDYSDGIDFLCPPLLFIEQPRQRRVIVEVRGRPVVLPIQWTLLVGDRDTGDATFLPIVDVLARNHEVVLFNPFTSRICSFSTIREVGEAETLMIPRIAPGRALLVPVENHTAPLCLVIGKPRGSCHFECEIADLLH